MCCLELLCGLLQNAFKWKWTETEINAFENTRELLIPANLLVHYNINKPLVLAYDVSPYGLGVVMSHILENESERSIAFTSWALRNTGKWEIPSVCFWVITQNCHWS